MAQLIEIFSKYPNLITISLGAAGMFFTALFGWMLKRPMVRVMVEAESSKTTRSAYEAVIKMQAETITQLRSQLSVSSAYEVELIARIHEGDERYLRDHDDTHSR